MPPQKFYSDQICSLLKFNGILVGPLEYKNVKTPAIFTENESGTKKKIKASLATIYFARRNFLWLE